MGLGDFWRRNWRDKSVKSLKGSRVMGLGDWKGWVLGGVGSWEREE